MIRTITLYFNNSFGFKRRFFDCRARHSSGLGLIIGLVLLAGLTGCSGLVRITTPTPDLLIAFETDSEQVSAPTVTPGPLSGIGPPPGGKETATGTPKQNPSPAPGNGRVEAATATPGSFQGLNPEDEGDGTPAADASLSAVDVEFAGLSIDELTRRAYGGGKLEISEILAENSYFTRALIRYPSDELQIYGFMNNPRSTGETDPNERFPVIIALHGYIEPEIYQTLDYTTGYADALARAGFLVIHPNLRGYPPSDDGDNRFRVGMAIDVLNLIAIIKDQAGLPGPLEKADPESIGLWGHSMGGGVATRVITISPDVDAVVLYGAMSGDDRKNYERIFNYFSNGTRGLKELQAPEEVFERVSPINFLERIQAAVSIHHGKADPDVPLTWAIDLCQRLEDLGKSVECYTYLDQAHTFHGEGETLFNQRAIQFFNKQLKPR